MLWVLYALGFYCLAWGHENAVEKGRWLVENLGHCPEPEQYAIQYDVMRRKVNRTHDMFYAKISLPDEVNKSNYGVKIDVCKKVDGGCKLQYTFNEVSFCDFVNQFAEDNFRKALTLAGLEDPDCPIPEGLLEFSDFIFDYQELPEDGMPGKFNAMVFITKGSEGHMCLMLDLDFSPADSDEDEDEDEE